MSNRIQQFLCGGALLPLTVAGLAFNAPAIAQDDDVFEEIVVTVQRREQSIMDVPVAVSAVSGAEIQAAGIKDMFDLQQNVPGLIVGQSQTSTSTNFSIRGVGSTANNFGVESSVGLYVDGVYRSRQSSLVNDLADIETVEVARGPQGTLFGKNTPSGAIIIRTIRPSQDRDGYIDVTAGDLNLVRVQAAANFPVTENVAMRASFFMSDRDGYVDDLVMGDDLYNDRDRTGGRLQLAVNEPSDDFNMRIIADYAEIDERCCVAVHRVDGIFSQASLAGIPQPGSDFVIASFFNGTIFTDFPYPAGFLPPSVVEGVSFDDFVVAYDSLPRSENSDSGLSVEINKDVGDSATFTSITAVRNFETFDTIDADFTNVPLISRTNDAKVDSISQEFRLSGEFGEGNNYVVGAYYFGQEIDSETFTGDASGIGLLGAYIGALNPDLALIEGGVDLVAMLAGPPYMPAGTPFPAGVFALDNVNQDQDGWAVFGQVDWSLTDNVMLTVGGRYTDETKKIRSSYQQTAQGPEPDLDGIAIALCQADPMCILTLPPPLQVPLNPADPATFALFSPFFFEGWGSYLFAPLAPQAEPSEKISDDQTTGTIKLSWFPNDSSLLYISYATGFKSGGTNVDRLPPVFSPIFDAETSESIEIGFKGEWGPVQLKAAIYDMEYEDFQAQTFTGTGFNLQNAGKLSTEGIELELLWRPTDTTEIQAHYAHNEGEYDDFILGTCWDTYSFHTGIPDPGEGSGATSEQCDHTGFELPYNPEDQWFLALTQDFDVGSNTSIFVRGEYRYTSSLFTDGDNDPFTKQDSFEIVNARLGFRFDSYNSELTLWGRNITDERYYEGSFDQPIGAGRMNSYPAEPRTWGLSFRKDFE